MNKKLLILPLMLLFAIGMVLAAPETESSLCTQTSTSATTALTLLNGTAVIFFTATTDTSYSGGTAGFNNVTPTTQIILEQVCDNVTVLNGTAVLLNWKVLDIQTEVVTNATDGNPIGNDTVNYTMDYPAGTITLTNNTFNNTLWQVCYNKTFAITYNLVPNTTRYSVPSTADYGDDVAITGKEQDLNNTDWTTSQVVYTRTCDTRDSCEATQGIIYAGFALLALAAIVLAAFALIAIFSGGDVRTAGFAAIVIGIIGLGIVLMIGYVIISKVGSSVCLV